MLVKTHFETVIAIEREITAFSKKYQKNKKLGVEDFERLFPEISESVKKIEKSTKKHAVIIAKVKSGKRIIKELLSLRSSPDKKHFYLSAWNRKDEKSQLEELNTYGIAVFIIRRQGNMIRFGQEVKNNLSDGYEVIIHFNESDFGTANGQLISNGFNEIIDMPKVKFRFYSATNEELIFSNKLKDCEVFEIKPSSLYRGDEWFLDNDLIREAEPFWDTKQNKITDQGMEACNLLKNNKNKLIGVVRFANGIKNIRNNKKFRQTIEADYGFKLIFVSEVDRLFDWSESHKQYILDWANDENFKIMIVIVQTCSRSTEIGFHKLIAFWHDYRGKSTDRRRKSTPYNTELQSSQRVGHYFDGSENYITVYTSKDVWLLSASRMDYQEFIKRTGSKISDRISSNPRTNCYKKFVLDEQPTKQFISEEFAKIGKFFNSKDINIKKLSCKNGAATNIASAAINGTSRSTIGHNSVMIYDMDSFNAKWVDSWEAAIKEGLVGKFVMLLPIDNIIDITTRSGSNGSIFNACDKSVVKISEIKDMNL